jgi:hypothetical protein
MSQPGQLRRGTVVANRAARRVVRLGDGAEITFDLEVCEQKPHVEEPVWVALNDSGTRAVRLTTVDPEVATRVAASRAQAPGLTERLAALRSAGLARELDEPAARQLLEDLGLDQEDALVPILDAYYQEHEAAARRDGWVSADWRAPVADFACQIAAAAGGAPLLSVCGSSSRDTTERGHRETRHRLACDTRHGRIELDVEHLQDLLGLANRLLAQDQDPRRFIDLSEDDQVIAVLLAPEPARSLAEVLGRPGTSHSSED